MKKQFKSVGLLVCLLVVFAFPGQSSAEVAGNPESFGDGYGIFVQQFFGGPLEIRVYIGLRAWVGDFAICFCYAFFPEPPLAYVFAYSSPIPLLVGVTYPVTDLIYWGFDLGDLLGGFMGTPANLTQGYWMVL